MIINGHLYAFKMGNFDPGKYYPQARHRKGDPRHHDYAASYQDTGCKRANLLGITKCVDCTLALEECPNWKQDGRNKEE